MTHTSLISSSTTEFSKSERTNVATYSFRVVGRNNFILDKDKTENSANDAEQRTESIITFK